MKHIAIIPNYSGITGLIKDGEISPNFLVKSENDNKVYFSNADGYYIIANGERYNMYKEGIPIKAAFNSTGGFSFQLFRTGDESAMTLDCDVAAYLSDGLTTRESIEETQESASTFSINWPGLGDTSWEVTFYPPGTQGGTLLQILGTYTMTEQETCEYNGCTWNDETQECECGEDPGGCGDDPECECNETDGYHYWDGETCHNCEDEWEELGYSSAEECACDKRGIDSGVCPEEGGDDPCDGFDEGTEERCNCEGRYWWADECHDEPEPEE